MTILFRKVDTEEIDDDDKVENSLTANDEELISCTPKSGKREKVDMKEIDPAKLEILKMRKQKEREMIVLLKDLIIYSIFLFFLMSLAGNNRNISAYYLNNQVRNLFTNDGNLDKAITQYRYPQETNIISIIDKAAPGFLALDDQNIYTKCISATLVQWKTNRSV